MSLGSSKKYSPVLAVARWEFGRYFKLRDQLLGMIGLLIGGGVGMGAVKLSQYNSQIKVLVQDERLLDVMPEDSNVVMQLTEESAEALREQVQQKQVDAALIVAAASSANTTLDPVAQEEVVESASDGGLQFELLVRSESGWIEKLKVALNQLHSQQMMQQQGISAEMLAAVFSPASVQVINVAESTTGTGDRIAAVIVLVLVILASWMGLAYFLTGISGEKQQRVTEQIVSAISAQSWIDGKLLGITAASIASVMNLLITGVISLWIMRLMGSEIPLPEAAVSPAFICWAVIYFVGGVFLWNCFYASVATVINDPNTSARSGLMFLPILPMATAAFAMDKPDGSWMQALSLIPGSSVTAMPIRLLLGDVSAWQLGVSVTLLVLAIVLLRTIAGRIFRAGILLVGKEPSWLDIVRWSIKSS